MGLLPRRARGNAARDTLFAEPDRRTVVTELVSRGTTIGETWSPHTAGNGFHCHVVEHISGHSRPRGLFLHSRLARLGPGRCPRESGLVMGFKSDEA